MMQRREQNRQNQAYLYEQMAHTIKQKEMNKMENTHNDVQMKWITIKDTTEDFTLYPKKSGRSQGKDYEKIQKKKDFMKKSLFD